MMYSKKLIFLVDHSFNHDNHVGVRKKVNSQLKLFQKNGIEASLQFFEWVDGKPQFEIPLDTDLLYFRNIGFSIRIVQKLWKIKKSIPNIKIIMEIPTYPFAGEQKDLCMKERINAWISKLIWRFCIDRFVVMGMDEKQRYLYGIPVIHAINGVNFEEEEIVPLDLKEDAVNMICVSGCYYWHGYDRLIKGMEEYYSKNKEPLNVNLYIVGVGDCLEEYRELAGQADLLDKHIFLCGKLEGKDLQEVYNHCNLAVECLALHRKDIRRCGSIKSREYAAKGLPMITSAVLDISNDLTSEYILKISEDDSNIDIEEIVRFWHKLYKENKDRNIRTDIRNVFAQYCSWEIVFKDVICYMKA